MHIRPFRLLLIAFAVLFAFVFAVPLEDDLGIEERNYNNNDGIRYIIKTKVLTKWATKTSTKWSTKYSKTLTKTSTKTLKSVSTKTVKLIPTKTVTAVSTKIVKAISTKTVKSVSISVSTKCTTKVKWSTTYATKYSTTVTTKLSTVTVHPLGYTPSVTTRTVTVSGYFPGQTGTIVVTAPASTVTDVSVITVYADATETCPTVDKSQATEDIDVESLATSTTTSTTLTEEDVVSTTTTTFESATTTSSSASTTTISTTSSTTSSSPSSTTSLTTSTTSEAVDVPTTTTSTTSSTTMTTTTTTTTVPEPTLRLGSVDWELKGCFQEPQYDRVLGAERYIEDDMNVEQCWELCSSHGYKFAGVENGDECWCDNVILAHGYEDPVASSSCEIKVCTGDSTEWCGSSNHIWVFEDTRTSNPSGPQVHPGTQGYDYLECVSTYSDIFTAYTSGADMTPQYCISYCASADTWDVMTGEYGPFVYAALRNGDTCYCGNQLENVFGASDSNCDTPCAGHDGFLCGGVDNYSLYKEE